MKEFFINWYNNFFADNRDFDAPDRAQIFSWQQLLLCFSIVLVLAIILVIVSKKSKKTQNITLTICAIIILVLEVFRWFWLWFVRYGEFTKFIFHFNLCNILAVFIPLSVLLFKNRTCYSASFLYGIIGGLVVMIYPRDVVAGYYLGHIIVLQSLLSHSLFIFVAILLVITGKYKIDAKKDWWRSGIVLTIFTIIAKIMVPLYDYEENFLFMREFDLFGLNNVSFWVYYPICLISVWLIGYLLLLILEKLIYKKRKT